MDTDFLDAHLRHWQDAEQLFASNRLANADHLYGMAAECGLKRLMVAFGMPVRSIGSPANKSDWVHANQAWVRYEAYRSGHHQGVSFPLQTTNPFDDWDVSQRYANQINFDQVRVDSHRLGAETVRKLIRTAQKEGLI
ncbi:MAG: SAM-dependent methyltransferase [Desulfobulbaceae bacterium]